MINKPLFILLFSTTFAFGQTNVKVINFYGSDCDETTLTSRLRTRIIKKSSEADLLTLTIATVAVCCAKFEGTASLVNNILYLDYVESGEPCECSCCYTFNYTIKGIKDANVEVRLKGETIELSDEKFKTYPISFRILNNDTINYTDRYGLRQGLFTFPGDSLMKKGFIEYVDDVKRKLVDFYESGKIKSISIIDLPRYVYTDYTLYFESGKIKKHCTSKDRDSSYFDDGMCREWNEKGELIYDGKYRR